MQEKAEGKYRPGLILVGESIVVFQSEPTDQRPAWMTLPEEQLREKPGTLIDYFSRVKRNYRRSVAAGKAQEAISIRSTMVEIDTWLTRNVSDWQSEFDTRFPRNFRPVRPRGK